MNPRALAVVTETFPPEVNGVALTLARLVEGLRARGHAVSVVRPRQPAADPRAGTPEPWTTLVRGLPLPGYDGLRCGLPAGATLRAAWTRRRPDAVYVATEGPLGWSAVRAARALGIAALSGFHTNFDGYARHYRAGWLARPVTAHLRRFHNGTAGTLVASLDLRDRLQAAGFRNLSVLGRGVDGRRFTPDRRSAALRRTWGAGDDDQVVLYVGRIAPEKNLGLAVEAFRAVQRVRASARFVLVGDGPMLPALRGAHPDLVFCGLRLGESLAEHYASGDLFLFPSETETFGNVTLEAMASGLAVVAYDYAAARTHVTDGESGVLVPYRDARAFIDAAARLARSPETVAAIRRRARAAAAAADWADVVQRFETLLLDAARRGGVAPRALPGSMAVGGTTT